MKSIEPRISALEKQQPESSIFDEIVDGFARAAALENRVPADDEESRASAEKWSAIFSIEERFASFLAHEAAETRDGVFALERLRGLVSDEFLRLCYRGFVNRAGFSHEGRLRLLRLAGIIDENDELRPGHSWVRDEKWGLISFDAALTAVPIGVPTAAGALGEPSGEA